MDNFVNVDMGKTKDNRYIHFVRGGTNLPLSVLQIGWHHTMPNYEYGPMTRDHYLIHFVEHGKGNLHIYDHVYPVEKNTCFLIRPYDISTYSSDFEDPWSYFWIGFSGNQSEDILNQIGFSKDRPVLSFENMDQIFETFRWIDGYNQENYLLYQSVLYKLLHILTQGENQRHDIEGTKGPVKNISTKNDYVSQVVSIIENSFTQKLNIEQLAKMLHLSRNYLSRIFKEVMGKGLNEFITEYRLTVAARKIVGLNLSISEIALQTGFSDPLYFSRVFKKRFGVSPTQYRLEHRIL